MAPCPTPEKKRYATREAAEAGAGRSLVAFGRWLNQYACRCGWWHNTHLADAARYETPSDPAA